MSKSDITYIIKLNKEIENFVNNQKEVIRSFKRDNKIRQCDVKFISTLFHNLDTLIYKKDVILDLREDKQVEELRWLYETDKKYNNI